MASRYLLDTNALSHLMLRPQGSVAGKISAVGEARVCTSIVVACELRFGARKKKSAPLTQRVEQLLQSIEVIALEPGVDRAYAEIRDRLESAGRPIGGNDLLIAAHAVNQECVLVTDNIGEFRRIAGLRVENWIRE
jgi:tRNA(fMet)-specific endonuclease VapC